MELNAGRYTQCFLAWFLLKNNCQPEKNGVDISSIVHSLASPWISDLACFMIVFRGHRFLREII